MKIAFCIENFKPARGGAERYVYDLSHLLCERGHQVHIYALSGMELEKDNLFLHMVTAPRGPRFLRTFYFAVRCRQQVREGHFDVIHSFGRTWGMDVFQPLGGSQMASLVGNLRSIENFWGRAFKVASYIFSLRRMSYFIVEKAQMRDARVLVAISPMVKNDLLRYNRLSPDKIRIVRNGIDLEKFHPRNKINYRQKTRLEMALKDRDILILFVAHNFRLKGLRPLIHTLACLKRRWPEASFKLAVLGEGKIKQFAGFARKKDVRNDVIFLGSKEDTHRYYASADICVHPSFYDPSALVVLEAMASGLPVITTTYCGTSEIIEEGEEGYVVENPRDVNKLAETIVKLTDTAGRRIMGDRARRKSEEFPYIRNMQEILEIYNECIGNSS